MCGCGLKAGTQSVINGAYMEVTFTSNVLTYLGITTGRLYGDFIIGDILTINVADYDNSVMTQN